MADDEVKVVYTVQDETTAPLKKMTAAATGLEGAAEKAATGLEALITASQKLQLVSLKNASALQKELQSTVALAKARAAASENFGLGQNTSFTATAGTIKTMNALYAQQAREETEAAAAARALAKAQQDAAYASYESNLKVNQGLASTRYALYDVASSWRAISVATLGTVAGIEAVGVAFQNSFADVARTTGATGKDLADMREQLINLTTEIPQSFGSLTQAATLGAQLGIANDQIVEFTDNVVKFSATTNTSVQDAATGFGRIAQLTKAGKDSWQNIGSAIYEVGVTSVATESQILNVANEIATAGNLAGLTTDQVIGLAGALASLGVQPYLARGSITRIFNDITKAVAVGGSSLQAFAQLSGQSADQFAQQWKSAPLATFQRFLEGLKASDQAGHAVALSLKEVGISSSNDIKVLSLLSNNLDVLSSSLATSNQAYQDGTALAEGYGIKAQTTLSALKELANTILAIADAAANAKELGVFVNILKDAAKYILEFTQSTPGKFISAVAIGLTALIGLFAASRAATALMQASILAFRLAQQQAAKEGVNLDASLKTLATDFLRLTGITDRAAVSMAAFRASTAAGEGTVKAFGAGATAATGGVRALGGALSTLGKSTVITAAITAALWGLMKAWDEVSRVTASNKSKAEDFLGGWSGLTDAIKEDTATFNKTGDAIKTYTTQVTTSSSALPAWAQQIQNATGQQVKLKDAVAETTQETRTQVTAIGQATAVWLAQQYSQSTQFQSIWKQNSAALQAAGFDISEYLKATLQGNGVEYINGIFQTLQGQFDALNANTKTGIGLYSDQAIAIGKAQESLLTLTGVAKGWDDEINSSTNQSNLYQQALQGLGIATGDLGDDQNSAADDAANLTQALQDQANTAWSGVDGMVGLQNSIYALGQGLAENGKTFDIYSQAGRANLQLLSQVIDAAVKQADGDAQALANSLNAIQASIGAYGINLAQVVPQYANLLNSLPPALGDTATAGFLAGDALKQGYAAGAQKAATGAGQAAKSTKALTKEVYTLTDYVNDLGSVLKNAFDIRFGLQSAKDDVTSTFLDMKKAAQDAKNAVTDAFNAIGDDKSKIADAKNELKQLQAAMAGLKSDRNILVYQLKVAQDYGDTLRAGEIQAELAQNSADQADNLKQQADARKDLADANKQLIEDTKALVQAQKDAQATLKGNTQSAIDQRNAVLNLVNAYESQIVALANSGLSQDKLKQKIAELKQQFKDQLTQLGYNKDEIDKYSKAFDDATKIVGKLPKNITTHVGADTSPADRAIAEFLAKNTKGKGASQTIHGKVAYSVDNSALRKNAKIQTLLADITSANKQLARTDNPSAAAAISEQIHAWERELLALGYARGGFTGQGGKYEVAGVVHKGEYVVPKQMVNQSTGLPYASALGQIMSGYSGGGYVGGPSTVNFPDTLVVQLSPTDRALLANSGGDIYLDGKVLATAVNANNTQSARRGSR